MWPASLQSRRPQREQRWWTSSGKGAYMFWSAQTSWREALTFPTSGQSCLTTSRTPPSTTYTGKLRHDLQYLDIVSSEHGYLSDISDQLAHHVLAAGLYMPAAVACAVL